jgi:hypothetical protein
LWLLAIAAPTYCQDHGTAAFAVWQPDQIVIGTDSKIIHLDNSPADVICKIRPSGRFYFAMSGFYGKPGTDFDVWDIGERLVKTAQTVPEAATILENGLAAGLAKSLDSARLSNPGEFNKRLGKSYLAFFVAGIDSGKLILAGRDFVPTGVLKDEYPGTRPVGPGATGLSAFGERSVIDQTYTLLQQATLAAGDPIGTVRKFLQLEIDGEPATVGEPRSILAITTAGHRWEEEGLCAKETNSN